MSNTSQDIRQVAVALANFKKENLVIRKDAENPLFQSKYATYSAIQERVLPLLDKHGLIIIHQTEGDALNTMLIHAETGQFFSTSYKMAAVEKIRFGELWENGKPVKDGDRTICPATVDNIISREITPQAQGTALSYAKRYNTAALLDLVIVEGDDDGNVSSGKLEEETAKVVSAAESVKAKLRRADALKAAKELNKKLTGDTKKEFGKAWRAAETVEKQETLLRKFNA